MVLYNEMESCRPVMSVTSTDFVLFVNLSKACIVQMGIFLWMKSSTMDNVTESALVCCRFRFICQLVQVILERKWLIGDSQTDFNWGFYLLMWNGRCKGYITSNLKWKSA